MCTDKKGYSLVELIVAIGIFSMVAFIAVASLISITNASKKAQATRQAVDSVAFVMESIVRDATLAVHDTDWDNPDWVNWGGGKVYHTGLNNDANPEDGVWFSFKKIKQDGEGEELVQYYSWPDGGTGRLDVDGKRLTPSNVDVTNFYVEVFNGGEPTEYAVIILQAIINPGTKEETAINFQSSVAQRER